MPDGIRALGHLAQFPAWAAARAICRKVKDQQKWAVGLYMRSHLESRPSSHIFSDHACALIHENIATLFYLKTVPLGSKLPLPLCFSHARVMGWLTVRGQVASSLVQGPEEPCSKRFDFISSSGRAGGDGPEFQSPCGVCLYTLGVCYKGAPCAMPRLVFLHPFRLKTPLLRVRAPLLDSGHPLEDAGS